MALLFPAYSYVLYYQLQFHYLCKFLSFFENVCHIKFHHKFLLPKWSWHFFLKKLLLHYRILHNLPYCYLQLWLYQNQLPAYSLYLPLNISWKRHCYRLLILFLPVLYMIYHFSTNFRLLCSNINYLTYTDKQRTSY